MMGCIKSIPESGHIRFNNNHNYYNSYNKTQ